MLPLLEKRVTWPGETCVLCAAGRAESPAAQSFPEWKERGGTGGVPPAPAPVSASHQIQLQPHGAAHDPQPPQCVGAQQVGAQQVGAQPQPVPQPPHGAAQVLQPPQPPHGAAQVLQPPHGAQQLGAQHDVWQQLV